ncbi:MAG: SufD family Fe-S cluster assembly protein [Candidatus Azambacteria bacterium]|nr:SufD family Fe-S cluster assembly protein [Candidatus Azambacteria bacterium]
MKSIHRKLMKIPKVRINTEKSRTIATFSSECGSALKKRIILKEKNEHMRWLLVFEKTAPKTIDIAVTLAAKGACVDIGFAWHGTKNMASDIMLTVSHEAPKTESRVAFGAALEGMSKVYFRGLARVAKKAVGSRAHLSAKALMLSPRAIAFLKPDLEVATSEAIAGHGSSVGRPSDKELFYLSSRGMTEIRAKKMLCDAFLKDITKSQIAIPSSHGIV